MIVFKNLKMSGTYLTNSVFLLQSSKQKEIEINAVIISHLKDLRYSSVSSSS